MRCRSQRSGTLPRRAAQARSRSCSHRSTGASISDARGGAQAFSARRRSRRKVLVSPTWTAAPRSSSRQAAYSISQAIASGRSRRSSSVQTFLPRENRPSHSGASPTTRCSRRSSTGTDSQRRSLSWRMWPCVPSMKSAGTVSLRSNMALPGCRQTLPIGEGAQLGVVAHPPIEVHCGLHVGVAQAPRDDVQRDASQ